VTIGAKTPHRIATGTYIHVGVCLVRKYIFGQFAVFVTASSLLDNRLNISLLQILKTLLGTVLAIGYNPRGLADVLSVLLDYLRNR
jgi:hypothetical protein